MVPLLPLATLMAYTNVQN